MKTRVKISQTALASFDDFPTDVQKKIHKVISMLETGNEECLHSQMLVTNPKLRVAKVSSNVRIIYKRTDEGLEIIDVVDHKTMQLLAKSGQGKQ